MKSRTLILSGTPVSPGLAMGAAYVFEDIFESNLRQYSIKPDEVDREFARIEDAITEVLKDLSTSASRVEKELESALADIFRAHAEMLRDAILAREIRNEVANELINAEHAVKRVFDRWEQKFRAIQSEDIEQRGSDVVDLGRRLLRSLAGVHVHSLEHMPDGCILMARALVPSDATFFSCRSTAGVVVETGGPGSHCALLTRQLGIPGLAQVSGLLDRVKTGDLVLLDGLRGTVTLKPDANAVARFRKRIATYRASAARDRTHSHEPAVTADGVRIQVMANIGNRHDAEMAAENGADGIGLYRIEVFYLARKMLPTEDELFDEISNTIAPLKDKPVCVRLLDTGGDKSLPYLHIPEESDPFLGRRGVRLLLEYPELLNAQLRALLRVAQTHDLQIIVPMVTVPQDMESVRQALEKAQQDLGFTHAPRLGAMIETPAAALCAHDIAAVSDSLNVGTNDLTQYTMAASRENPLVSAYFIDDHPAILRLLGLIGRENGQTPVGICGELAGQTERVEAILGTGMRVLSVSPPLIPSVKAAVRSARVHHANPSGSKA